MLNAMYPNYSFMNYQQPRTDIGQVNSEQEAVNAYVAAGSSKIMFTADDRTVFVKSVSMNGQTTMDVFDRRVTTEAAPAAQPKYVTREELDKILTELKRETEAGK